MESFLEFLKGPLFRLTFLVMILGLLRHFTILLFGIIQAKNKAADPVPPFAAPIRKLTVLTLKWIFPVSHLKIRPWFTVVSVLFHVGLIVIPLFLFAHIQLWREVVGFGWPALNHELAEILTITTVLTGIILFFVRFADRNARILSRPQDYLVLVFLIIPFISGFFAVHALGGPVSYNFIMVIHVLSAEIVFLLIPFTKITHCVLYPLAHIASNFAWRFVPEGGSNVLKSLNKEERV